MNVFRNLLLFISLFLIILTSSISIFAIDLDSSYCGNSILSSGIYNVLNPGLSCDSSSGPTIAVSGITLDCGNNYIKGGLGGGGYTTLIVNNNLNGVSIKNCNLQKIGGLSKYLSIASGSTVTFDGLSFTGTSITSNQQLSTECICSDGNIGSGDTTFGTCTKCVLSISPSSITWGASSNNAPTDITLSNNNIGENSAIGTEVGTLDTVDADVGDTHTYSILLGNTGGMFEIVGDKLKLAGSPDFETISSYTLDIETSDGTDTYHEEFIISIVDIDDTSPTATSIDLSDLLITDSDVGGSAFSVTITYDEDMDETVNPTVQFNLGSLSTLTACGNSWINPTNFKYSCTISDQNVELANVDISVTGGKVSRGGLKWATQGRVKTGHYFN